MGSQKRERMWIENGLSKYSITDGKILFPQGFFLIFNQLEKD